MVLRAAADTTALRAELAKRDRLVESAREETAVVEERERRAAREVRRPPIVPGTFKVYRGVIAFVPGGSAGHTAAAPFGTRLSRRREETAVSTREETVVERSTTG